LRDNVETGEQRGSAGGGVVTEQPQDPSTETAQQPVTDEALDPRDQPAAGGADDSEPAQGEGAPDSW
jgi:hypothetical protein